MAFLAGLSCCESQTFGPQSGRMRTKVQNIFADLLNKSRMHKFTALWPGSIASPANAYRQM